MYRNLNTEVPGYAEVLPGDAISNNRIKSAVPDFSIATCHSFIGIGHGHPLSFH